MNKILFLSVLCLFTIQLRAQENPLNVQSYKLDNGLTVYLNVDKTMPMVHGMVVVKGGGKRDPKDATGIAHYFEHILFKGTDEIGTIDYKTEKLYLDSISKLYDDLGKTKDKDKRLTIQKEINRISVIAANYAIPNELDKILNGMGGKNVNAGTGYEAIYYYNSVPANQIEKWLEVYSHRFINPVFRLFQSELETVYEEKNLYADDPMQNFFMKFNKEFYKTSPYGQQTILGTTDHLKNPSLSKMQEYFDTYYVAKNMALVLSGDFDPEKLKPIIKKKFGKWRSGEKPKELAINESPFKGRELVKKRLTPIKVGVRGYRTVPKNHPDELGIELCSRLLSNQSSTGLLDRLHVDNKLLAAGLMSDAHTEVGGAYLFFLPKIIGQPLKKAEKYVAIELEKLRKGEFDDELLEGVKTEMKKDYEKWIEDMRWRTYAIARTFIYKSSWQDVLNAPSKISKLTKKDVTKIASTYFADNYLAFYSKMGFPKKDKIKKPPFKPVQPKNAEKKSDYAKMVEEIPIVELAPRFIDFDKDVKCVEIDKGINAYITPNPINKIFSLRLVFGKGTYKDPLVNQAATMLDNASPKGVKFEEFKQKLQLQGCSFYTYSNLNSTIVEISGLEDHLEASLKLVNELLQAIDLDEKHLKKLYQNHKLERKFENKDVYTKGQAITDYLLYGENSTFLNRLSSKEIKKLNIDSVIAKIREIINYEYDVHYCGTKSVDEFCNLYKKTMNFAPDKIKKTPFTELERKQSNKNVILFIDDKKAIQSHINFIVEGGVNNENSLARMDAFNDYIGGGMASIIFQEIREFRSLAYGSYGRYEPSFYRDRPGYFKAWLSTQADKTTEAVEVFIDILKNMPEKPERIDEVRKNLTLSINANQSMLRRKSMKVSHWKEQGYNEDPRKQRYGKYENIQFDEIVAFYKQYLKGKPITIAIVGDKKRINMKKLGKFGEINYLNLKDIYGN